MDLHAKILNQTQNFSGLSLVQQQDLACVLLCLQREAEFFGDDFSLVFASRMQLAHELMELHKQIEHKVSSLRQIKPFPAEEEGHHTAMKKRMQQLQEKLGAACYEIQLVAELLPHSGKFFLPAFEAIRVSRKATGRRDRGSYVLAIPGSKTSIDHAIKHWLTRYLAVALDLLKFHSEKTKAKPHIELSFLLKAMGFGENGRHFFSLDPDALRMQISSFHRKNQKMPERERYDLGDELQKIRRLAREYKPRK